MINKILVATDGSASSNRAIDLASEMSIVHNASLHVINVIRQIQIPPEMQNRARVKSLGATLAKKFIGHEDPAVSVSGYAKKHGIGLLVIGTRGLSKVRVLLMGSVPRKVTEICEVNCLIVR